MGLAVLVQPTVVINRLSVRQTNHATTATKASSYKSLILCCITYTLTHAFNGPFPGLPGWAGTRKVTPIWIFVKQETVSGSGISWTICKSAPRSRQITTPAPHYSVFYRPDALPVAQPTASKHWRLHHLITEKSRRVQNTMVLLSCCYLSTV